MPVLSLFKTTLCVNALQNQAPEQTKLIEIEKKTNKQKNKNNWKYWKIKETSKVNPEIPKWGNNSFFYKEPFSDLMMDILGLKRQE